MLINNSLPIIEGKYDNKKGKSVFSRKLIVDKKILLNLLIDLQRFRKLLNLKKMNVRLNHSLNILMFILLANTVANIESFKIAKSDDDDPFEVKRIINVIKTMGK